MSAQETVGFLSFALRLDPALLKLAVFLALATGLVFALLGMPLAREPFLYAPIPGFKLD